jgi:hypothetical protein
LPKVASSDSVFLVRISFAARTSRCTLSVALVAMALASCRGARDAAAPGEGQSTYAGQGNRLAYCCIHEERRPSSPAAGAYAHCESAVRACTSDDGEFKSPGSVRLDTTWSDEIRRARRASWCCYSWKVPQGE